MRFAYHGTGGVIVTALFYFKRKVEVSTSESTCVVGSLNFDGD